MDKLTSDVEQEACYCCRAAGSTQQRCSVSCMAVGDLVGPAGEVSDVEQEAPYSAGQQAAHSNDIQQAEMVEVSVGGHLIAAARRLRWRHALLFACACRKLQESSSTAEVSYCAFHEATIALSALPG